MLQKVLQETSLLEVEKPIALETFSYPMVNQRGNRVQLQLSVALRLLVLGEMHLSRQATPAIVFLDRHVCREARLCGIEEATLF